MRQHAVRIMVVLASAACFASEPSPQYHFDSWTIENGLPENSIVGIRQTRDGYLWMTTSSGMVRFDGVRFQEFNRLNTPGLSAEGFTYYALMEDRRGCLWAGTWTAGVVRYCQGVFTTFTDKDGLPGNRVVRIDEDDDGAVWFYTDPGLAKWKNGRMERVAPAPGSPFNDVLIGMSERADLRIASMVEDSKDRLWYRFRNDLETYYCLNQGRLTVFRGTPAKSFVSYQDAAGNLWESAHDGHNSLWKTGQEIVLDGFSTPFLFRAIEDREGSLWLGTTKSGLFRATRAAIATERSTGGPEQNIIQPVLQDRDGSIWYGSRGLFHLSNGRSRTIYHSGAVLRPAGGGAAQNWQNIISALDQDADSTLWAGTWDGLARLSGETLVSDGLTASIRGKVNAIHRDRAGDLWIGCERGLYRLHGTTLTHFTLKDGLGSDDVRVIRESRNGALWVGTAAGLAIRTGGGFSRIAAPGPDTQNITALYEDDSGALWIGTYDVGLYRFEGGKLAHFTTSNGLGTNSVFQILEDDGGFLWLSGLSGVQRVRKDDLNAFAAGRRTVYASTGFGRADGMDGAECSSTGQPNGIKARDGKLWFPTTDGLAVLDPHAAAANPHPPPVVVGDPSVDGQTVTGGEGVILHPGQLSLDIPYTALSFIKSGQIRFRYKMEGLDFNWIEAGTRRTAYYTRLPPGSYTFHVIAANSDGLWNTQGATVAVRVLPPFYRTWWFDVLVSLAAITVVTLVWRYRVSQFERAQVMQQAFSRQLIASQEEERKRIAAELHDSLGQRLIIVKNLAMFFLRKQDEDALGSGRMRAIQEISDEAALAIDETRQISYNLRPFQLDRLGLTKAIEGIVRTASSASPTGFSLEIDNIDDAFPEDLRINFYRIVQESLNNVIKHAQATEVKISVKRTAELVLLTIRDNGIGFTPGSAKSEPGPGGFGVAGMAERARLLGGELAVQATPGHGAVVSVRILTGETKGER